MWSTRDGELGPTPAGAILRWHSHVVCKRGQQRGLKPPASGRCPPGSRLTQGTSEMLHVWFTRDLRSAFAIRAPEPELCAARPAPARLLPALVALPRLRDTLLGSVRVPVLVLTGPTGVGKSAVLSAASSLLSEAGVRHASVTLSDIAGLFPAPVDDEWNERIAHRNLQSLWRNFAAEGAERLLLERVVETRSLLERIVEAVPGADITVVRLRAPIPLLHERILAREAGDPAWYLEAAAYLDSVFDTAGVEDFVVDNVDRSVRAVAADVLRLAGWNDDSTATR